jgi:hypothetical protein
MNLKFLILGLISPLLLAGQEAERQIEITKFHKGYWHLQEGNDSIYLWVKNPIAYYNAKDTPRVARMKAHLVHLPTQQLELIEIQFDYLDTLPSWNYARDLGIENYGSENRLSGIPKKGFYFKRLLSNQVSLQIADSTHRTWIFEKLKDSFPQAIEFQVHQLRKIETALDGFWQSDTQCFFVQRPTLSIETTFDSLEVLKVSLSVSGICFLSTQEQAPNHRVYEIGWHPSKQYTYQDNAHSGRFRMDKDTFWFDSNRYFRQNVSILSDSMIQNLSKTWQEQETSNSIYFELFKIKPPFVSAIGTDDNWKLSFVDFLIHKNHCFAFIYSPHSSINFWEITELTEDKMSVIEHYTKGSRSNLPPKVRRFRAVSKK